MRKPKTYGRAARTASDGSLPTANATRSEVGDYLRSRGITVDAVLCSSAARARQTLELLKLDDQLDPDRVEIADRFYNAGADTLINAVRELPDDCHVALLVGHAPGAPGVVYELTDPGDLHAGGSQCDRGSVSRCCPGTAGVRG